MISSCRLGVGTTRVRNYVEQRKRRSHANTVTALCIATSLHIILRFTQYWRNDYVGIEQYSAFTEDGKTLLNAKLKREHVAFARTWDANLRAQGFLEAFMTQQKGDN
jgi:hypothetical protein